MIEDIDRAIEFGPDQLLELEKADLVLIIQELQRRVPRVQYTVNEHGFRVFSREWREKLSKASLGNESGARPYPAFRNEITSDFIPAGVNLAKICRERGLNRTGLQAVKKRRLRSYKGWVLAEGGHCVH